MLGLNGHLMKGHHCAFISTFHVKKVLIKVRSRRTKTISSCNLLLRILLSNGSIRREYNKHKKNVLNKPPIKLGNKFAELVAADIPLEFSFTCRHRIHINKWRSVLIRFSYDHVSNIGFSFTNGEVC